MSIRIPFFLLTSHLFFFCSGYDADRTYPLTSSYQQIDPLQPPITAPYKTAMELKRSNFYSKLDKK